MTMLQFSAMLYTATARIAPRSSWRFTALVACNSSTAVTGEQPAAPVNEDNNANFSKMQAVQEEKEQQLKHTSFQTFHTTEERNGRKKRLNDSNIVFFKQFQAAESVNDLLDLALLPDLSISNALKLISSITNQINSGKSQTLDIEADERFIHLRKIVKSNESGGKKTYEKSNLSKFSQLSTPAMIDVITSLREQRDRNTPLLKMLSYNIVKYNIALNLNQCATLLYSMAILNFPDKVLLEKIASDLLECIPKSKNAALNKSIITSLGFLRYKNMDILDAFCNTLFMKSMDYRFLDYSSILQTFAALQYKSQKINLFLEKFAEHASPFQISWIEWLDITWSLAVLDVVEPRHVKFLLDPALMERISAYNQLNISKILKLLNINAVAQFVLKDYEGPLLQKDSEFNNISITRSKEKQMYINALLETLTEILPSSSYFQINFDTNMGFLLDAEYRINSEHRFVKVEDWNEQSNNVRRIAIMVYDYHDYCIGQNDLIGSQYLYIQLLKARGYEIITISYENFSVQDNVKKRINYLKQCMNSIKEMKPAKQMKSI